MSFIAAAALAVAIGMLVHAHYTSNASPHYALAADGSPIGDLNGVAVKLNGVAVKAPPEYWFPRASTYPAEAAIPITKVSSAWTRGTGAWSTAQRLVRLAFDYFGRFE
jgi:hypothetical protein